ncbi:MAG: hypothetical protein ACO1N0_17625 [Fluviicola sp.]
MVKKYFLKYACSTLTKEELATTVSEKLGIEFEKGSGGSLGYRFGELAESISIFDHYNAYDDFWAEENFKHCPVLLTASCTQGKNVEKAAKAQFLQDKFATIPELVEIRVQIL